MKYDRESGKILIGLKEFVTVARRCISTALPFDVDEPQVAETTRKIRDGELSGIPGEVLSYGFETLGYSFSLTAPVDGRRERELYIIRELDSPVAHPKKEEVAEIRGEGYVAAHILSENHGYDSVLLTFVYINPISGEISRVTEEVAAKKLRAFFDKCMRAVSVFARPEVERVTKRLPTLKTLKFPYGKARDGQDAFIRAAYRTLSRGGRLYAAAPTGTGKTVSAIYPALRTLGDERCEKVFYLTPKSTTAEAARECLNLIAERGGELKAIILTAKERICYNGHLCRESRRLCENAKCNKLAEATLAVYDSGATVVDAKTVTEVARQYTVCPYELSLAYAELCDVVICDINYLFDPRVYIRRFFDTGGGYAFLIDEAHNLHERAREMYSAEISGDEIAAVAASDVLGEFSRTRAAAKEAEGIFAEILHPLVKEEIRECGGDGMMGAAHVKNLPSELYTLIGGLLSASETELYESYRADDDEREMRISLLRDYYYRLRSFSDVLYRFDDCYEAFIFYDNGKYRLKLYCLDTGPIIRERLAKGHGAVLFSATLSPLHYYRAVLGGDRSDEMLEVDSPFDPSQLSVNIMDKISTRFSERDDTLGAVCRVIAATVSAKRGNYMIFSPSFAYSEALARQFSAKYPKLRVIRQKQSMTAAERSEFLAEFNNTRGSYLIGFCVMGGVFAEGVDLTGDALIGAIIVGIGMPSLSYEREAIAAYYQEKYEEGQQYAYIYPGMNRVFQAAGRVIRREDDRGVIVLIDYRFDDPIYRDSLPKLWEGVEYLPDAKTLKESLEQFWREES